ncbi:hypothetical protein JW916_13710, partial [Candidatus Sumerlaeota bacterium]|nr:hypothetical protein [Candidatus Sumerlaeota bacterium]
DKSAHTAQRTPKTPFEQSNARGCEKCGLAPDPAVLAFADGQWTGSLTLYRADTNVSIAPSATTAAGTIAADPSDAFDVVANGLDAYVFDAIASPQYACNPFDVTVTGRDAWGNVVTDLNGDLALGGRIPGGAGGSSIAITDCNPNSPDYIEIQNVSGETVDTSGWVVAISDSYSDINLVNAVYWSLPASVAPGEIFYRTDSSTLNYWGSNIFWSSGSNSWAMIVDDEGNVVDFVAWGWTEAAIAAMNPTVNTHSVVIGSGWSGDGVAPTGADSMQRQGSQDTDTAGDFAWLPNTMGTQSGGLTLPFTGGHGTVAIAPTQVALAGGVWTGPVAVLEMAEGVWLRGFDSLTGEGVSNLFDVVMTVPSMMPEPLWTSGTENAVYWAAADLASTYVLQVDATGDFVAPLYAFDIASPATGRTVTGLADGQTYRYRVMATDALGHASAWCAPTSSTQDAVVPVSAVTHPSGATNHAVFPIEWTATDPGGTSASGVRSVSVFWSKDGGPYQQLGSWEDGAPQVFFDARTHGGDGVYAFYSLAADRAGNVETKTAPIPDTTATVDGSDDPTAAEPASWMLYE